MSSRQGEILTQQSPLRKLICNYLISLLMLRRWVNDQEYESLDTEENEIIGPFGRDYIHFYTHFFQTDPASETVLSDNALQIASNATVRPGIVGLGSSSTILQGLVDSARIAGRTYSIYVGSGMDRAGGVVNGSLTLGGYDTGRFTGSIYEFAMKESGSNPLAVEVSDIVINEESDSSKAISLFKDGRSQDNETIKPFEAKITIDTYPMSFPYRVTQAFKALLSAEKSALSDGSLRLQKYFGGSMTIKLSGGFTITIPNNVMFNETQISPVTEREQNSTEPFLLSLAWLSQVYLMVDIESSKFFLAQAVAENKFITPETFCPGENPKLRELKKSDDFASTGMVGAVIGGVVGGLALITLVAFLVINGIRQRNQRRMKCVEYAHTQSRFSAEQDSENSSLRSQDIKGPMYAGRK